MQSQTSRPQTWQPLSEQGITTNGNGRVVLERFASSDPSARIAAAALRLLFGDAYARRFAIRLWDGTEVPAEEGAAFSLRINEPGALRLLLQPPPELNAGRAFAAGLLDCDGDLEAAVDELYRAIANLSLSKRLRLRSLAMRLPRATLPKLREARLHGKVHSLARDRAAIGFHYDHPVAFYRAILDRDLTYSCAYFDRDIDSLEDAQRAKIDYSLRKLRLAPGERLLDIGCGWGSLVLRAAGDFDARVLGVTLSRMQSEEARRRIRTAGMEDRAAIELRDYRELPAMSFDKIVSVGMFEHVGRSKLPEYFRTVFSLLRPGGLFLNHGIADERSGNGGRAVGFIDRFIFPDGELVPISETLQVAERSGFEVRDVENLREHYTRTLRAWGANIERNREEAIAATDEQTYRLWRLYIAGSAQGFRTGRMGVFQTLLAKPAADGSVAVPSTRRDLYV
jgi:cyclopropane-fatty-acyl-phospholipid synthase